MLANLTPQTPDILDGLAKLTKALDADFLKKCATELRKVNKAKKALADQEKTLKDGQEEVKKALAAANSKKAHLDIEIGTAEDATKALVSERAEVAELKKAFEAERTATMNDLTAKLADAEVQYSEARKLKTASEGEMKRVKALEASLKPAQDLVDKMAALKA